jgi:hypothetical protein
LVRETTKPIAQDILPDPFDHLAVAVVERRAMAANQDDL